MKKIILLLFFFSSIAAFAQSDHMEFMGIPIDGTVNSFEQKLTAKGFRNDRELNKLLPVGMRAIKGPFASYRVSVDIMYNETTKIVYGLLITLDRDNEDENDKAYDELLSLYKKKYKDWKCSYEKSSVTFSSGKGKINISKTGEDFMHIFYEDTINSKKNADVHNSDF